MEAINKIYVSFDYDSDVNSYYLMKAWTNTNNFDFEIIDSHDLNIANDSNFEVNIKNKLELRILNSKALILLIGENTKYLRKFVRWEIEYALNNNMPIIAVNLDGKRDFDVERCPELIKEKLVLHIPFSNKIIKYALDNWLNMYNTLKASNQISARNYHADLYHRLGM
jgi:hypothetical protein